MSDESERRGDPARTGKSVPPATVPRPASRPPDAARSIPAAPQTYPQHFRATTKMSADEIAEVIAATERAKAAGEFDPERTVVVDSHDIDADEAPTVDYDPRVRGVYMSPSQRDRAPQPDVAAEGESTPQPISGEDTPDDIDGAMTIERPHLSMKQSEGGRRRTSRRTVRIPDDQVRRVGNTVQIPIVAQRAPTAEGTPSPPRRARDGEATYRSENDGSTSRQHEHDIAEPPTIASDPSTVADDVPRDQSSREDLSRELVEEITIVRPLRIISIGSEPPPPFTSAEAAWPPAAFVPSEPPARHAAVEGPRSEVPSVSKTDLLPPPLEVPEDGWTPIAPPVSDIESAVSEALAQADGAADATPHSDSAPELETDLLEDVEPDAAIIAPVTTPKRPPPPPKKAQTEPTPLPSAAQATGSSVSGTTPAVAPAQAPPPPPQQQQQQQQQQQKKAQAETKPATDAESDLRTTAAEPGAKKKPKAWFEDLFSEDYIKTMDQLSPEHLRLEVDFIEESLGVEKQAVVLDLACGRGEHALELAARGYSVLGLDLSTVALNVAHAGAARMPPLRDITKPSFMKADMRELDFEENFDGAYCWSTSFGYFDDETNLGVLKKLHRALRQGGMLLIDVANRDFVAPRSPGLVWFEGDGCVCMDDMYVDFLTSRLRVKRTAMFEDGHSRELEYSIRLYSLSELGRMLHEVGFRVVEVTGHLAHPGVFFGTESPRLVVLAERS